MRKSWIGFGALCPALLTASHAKAAEVDGTISLVSDYSYRGLSLSEGEPALQGEVDIDAGRGLYSSLFASTIRNSGKTQSEFDFVVGKKFKLKPRFTLDLSTTYYSYLSNPNDNYAEATATVLMEKGPVTAKFGVSHAPAQRAMRDNGGRNRANSYVFAGADISLSNRPIKLSAQVGYERGPFDSVEHGGKWDWSVAASTDLKRASAFLTLVDSTVGAAKLLAGLSVNF